ncbi:MAG: hypothetical protein K9J16_07855 [Melioribacteraceae bacterium]|nr:hypothetical protein [Melioribacteraceae bacterium]MCF8353345.1 hypothetical protein [Melioribacteraceae bacterium]MCF8393209.1 hypothetical protein [Melioribacteraceae bacterium]MCF8419071.1 hypothetical protein [Melioribacteraceae bacterium]
MPRKSEPWYIHAVLYTIIVVLAYVLLQVAIINPSEVVEREKYFKEETRLRMANIREAEILWEKKHGQFTDNLDSLVYFVKNDTTVEKIITGFDTLTQRSTNPFKNLKHGEFNPDSLFYTPKSGSRFILKIDTTTSMDTILFSNGRIKAIDTLIVMGDRYLLEDPDGYGTIGDLYNDALKNAASWE